VYRALFNSEQLGVFLRNSRNISMLRPEITQIGRSNASQSEDCSVLNRPPARFCHPLRGK
jgi:hypothetical protein